MRPPRWAECVGASGFAGDGIQPGEADSNRGAAFRNEFDCVVIGRADRGDGVQLDAGGRYTAAVVIDVIAR